MKNVKELLEIIDLEPIEVNIFRGESHSIGAPRVFGGQVLAQALNAASRTVEGDFSVHSMHGYFILAGDPALPIIYQVERLRDGGSFATRRVTAIQKGRAIFNMAASYQKKQVGLDHQFLIPDVPPPEDLINDYELALKLDTHLSEGYLSFLRDRPIEFRPVEQISRRHPGKQDPYRHVWMRTKGKMPDDEAIHQKILAYTSDYNLITTAILPSADDFAWQDFQIASLDHAMWFHRAFRMDEWLLYAIDSPSASNARGFTRGSIFNRQGELVASVAQEGLIRKKRKK